MKDLITAINENKITTLRSNLIILCKTEGYNVEDDGEGHVLVVTTTDKSNDLDYIAKKAHTKKYFGSYIIKLEDKILICYDATFGFKPKVREKYGLK